MSGGINIRSAGRGLIILRSRSSMRVIGIDNAHGQRIGEVAIDTKGFCSSGRRESGDVIVAGLANTDGLADVEAGDLDLVL